MDTLSTRKLALEYYKQKQGTRITSVSYHRLTCGRCKREFTAEQRHRRCCPQCRDYYKATKYKKHTILECQAKTNIHCSGKFYPTRPEQQDCLICIENLKDGNINEKIS